MRQSKNNDWGSSNGNDHGLKRSFGERLAVNLQSSVIRLGSPLPNDATIAPAPVTSPLKEFRTQAFMEFTAKKDRRALVDHFCNVLSHLFVFKEHKGNPFQHLILRLAFMNVIFALSGAHLEYKRLGQKS